MTIDEAMTLAPQSYVTDGEHYYRYVPDPAESKRLVPNRTMTFYRCNRAGRLHPKRLCFNVYLGERLGPRVEPPSNLGMLGRLRRIEPNARGWLPVAKKGACEACHDRGWDIFLNTSRDVYEIERCDTCMKYESDRAAGDVAAPLIEAALAAMKSKPHSCGKGCRCRT